MSGVRAIVQPGDDGDVRLVLIGQDGAAHSLDFSPRAIRILAMQCMQEAETAERGQMPSLAQLIEDVGGVRV
jgi:hypothetical protein